MRTDLSGKVVDKQNDQKSRIDQGSKEREFTIGEQVLSQNSRAEPKWLDDTVTEQTGPVSYKELVGDQLSKQHVDRLCSTLVFVHYSDKDSCTFRISVGKCSDHSL